ncbi:MAG: Na/Pi cotransporter family protein [Eubacteriales bacterium]|nr:Na/Pi cotransporter family protein [Eubacteriales bacterium]
MALIYHIIALLGGLAMFLYGMRVMGDGLKSNSGGAMKAALAKVTNKPVFAFLLGMLVTCVIQSSTATIVLTVGLVGAGFLTFQQSVGIVLGANVGTAITAQVIRLMDLQSAENSIMYFFKADNLAPLALIIGMVILMTTKRESKKNMGNVACGFGVLFMGLIFMSDAVSVFGDTLSHLLTAFASNYLLGFLSGVVVTGVIQSSSAVVGIVQSVASSVGVTFNGVFAVIIGVNIGDCLTTYLVSRIGARPEQIRTAMVHVVYNILAALLMVVLLVAGRMTGLLNDTIWYGSLNSGGVANVHGLFRIIPAVCLLPFSNLLAGITEKIVPDKGTSDKHADDADSEMYALDPLLLTSPIMALDQVSMLVKRMLDTAYQNYSDCTQQVYEFKDSREADIDRREHELDRLTDAIGHYLVQLTPYIKRDRDFRRQNYQLKVSVCIERIGDLSVEITRALKELKRVDRDFSETAVTELRVIMDAVDEILNLAIQAVRNRDLVTAARIEPLEEVVDDMAADLNTRHVTRMAHNACDVYCGIQFQNVLASLESISDQCSDISIYLTELSESEIRGHEHEYIHQLHHSTDSAFQEAYKNTRVKYYSRLQAIPVMAEKERHAAEDAE